jgi:hypothetical protein
MKPKGRTQEARDQSTVERRNEQYLDGARADLRYPASKSRLRNADTCNCL